MKIYRHSLERGSLYTALIICFTLLSSRGFAQQISDLTVQTSGDDIVIRFDLKALENPQEQYKIQIFSSFDNYTEPLPLKEGNDTDVFPKFAMRYVIDGATAFRGYKGDLDFRVVATLTFVPLSLITPVESIKTKVGKTIMVQWKGGTENDTYQIDYAKDGGNWTTLDSDIHSRNYTWKIPKRFDKGIYSIKLTSSQERTKAIYSGNIRIKKKAPFIIKMMPWMLIAGGAYYYFVGFPENPIDGPTDNGIADPPEPPSN